MTSAHPQDAQIRALYAQFVDGWNRRSGAGVASGFTDDGDIVFFDGSHYRGRLSIAADLRQLFAEAPTPEYVAVARSVRPLAPGVALLIAHAGMIPPGGNDLDPRLLAVHTLVEPQYFVQPAQLFPLWPEWHPDRGISLYVATATLLFRQAFVVVPDNQLSLAIGKSGQRLRTSPSTRAMRIGVAQPIVSASEKYLMSAPASSAIARPSSRVETTCPGAMSPW